MPPLTTQSRKELKCGAYTASVERNNTVSDMGRRKVLHGPSLAVLTSTFLTLPTALGNVLTMIPIGQSFLFAWESLKSTMSPSRTLRSPLCHFESKSSGESSASRQQVLLPPTMPKGVGEALHLPVQILFIKVPLGRRTCTDLLC